MSHPDDSSRTSSKKAAPPPRSKPARAPRKPPRTGAVRKPLLAPMGFDCDFGVALCLAPRRRPPDA